ncbi:MAG: sulfurtransferase complex subunit TusD [Methylococcaceae bacterium]|nr:sulfurtransferase complex subunit TusD [Methylococcaceae bacterium]
MRFAIQVNASPNQSYSGYSAYRFCKAALSQGHEVFRVFFYHDGIYHAFKYNSPPDDEFQLTSAWGELAERHKVDLIVCISAAQRRGLLYADEAKRRHKQDDDVAAGFRIGGLGQWIEALIEADRVIVFG